MIPWKQARSNLANAVKDGLPPERVAELRRAYRVARMHHQLHELVAADPALPSAERRELARVLVGSDTDMAGVA